MNIHQTYNVALRFTPIADGLSRDPLGKPSRLFISVLLDLIPASNVEGEVTVDLACLPTSISGLLQRAELKIWTKSNSAAEWKQIPPAKLTRSKTGTNQRHAEQAWKDSMSDVGESLVGWLHRALTDTRKTADDKLLAAMTAESSREPNVSCPSDCSEETWHNRLLSDRAVELAQNFRDSEQTASAKNQRQVTRDLRDVRAKYWQRTAKTFEPLMQKPLVSDQHKPVLELSKPLTEVQIQGLRLEEELQKEFLRHNSFTVFEPPSSHSLSPTPDLDKTSEVEKRALDAAKRRWFALNSDPRLSTLLGLCLNFEIDATHFDSDELGILTAGFGGPDLSANCQTAYRLSYKHDSFQPASEGEYLKNGNADFEFGFLKGLNRIHIGMFDRSGAMRSSFVQAANRLSTIAAGSTNDHDIDRMPTLRSTGFELSDRKTSDVIQRRKKLHAKTRLKQDDANGGNRQPYYAEDLVVGYRIDIERTDSATEKKIWSSAVARQLEYGNGSSVFDNKEWNESRLRHRDDGCVRTLIRKIVVEKEGGTKVEREDFAKSEIFLWTGESLGLPSHDNRDASRITDDLNVGITYDFLAGADGALPVLRVGDSYRFALRACFRHGGGPRFSRRVAEQDGSLHDQLSFGACPYDGKASPKPVPFLPCDPVGSPVLAFCGADPLSKIPVDADENQQRIDRVVLFDKEHNHSALRILLPPRVSFETAEMQKQFDASTELIPRGALRHIERMADGQLPTIGLPSKRNPHSESEHESGFGPVVRAGISPAASPGYYCDAKGRETRIRLLRNESSCEDLPLMPLVVEFWKENQSPNDAKPIALEFRLGPSKMRGARFRPNKVDSTNRDKLIRSVGGVEMIVVGVEVAAGEEIQAEVWCADHSLNGMFKYNQIAACATRSSTKDKQAIDVRGMLSGLNVVPSDVLVDKLRIQVLTPVKKPIAPPALVPAKIEDKDYSFSIARLVSTSAEQAWAKLLETGRHLPSRQVNPYKGGDVAYVAGWISAARRSTTTVRVQAVWREFDDETCLERVKNQDSNEERWLHTPSLIVREFKPALATELPEEFLDAAPDESLERDADGIPLISIAKNELNGSLRNIHFELGTQAMRFGIRLIASSRFRSCFQQDNKTDESIFESTNYQLSDFEKDLPKDDVRVVWLPATERPPQPDLCEPKVELVSRVLERFRNEKKTFTERAWSFRIRLKKGTWYKSGEGELLGLVFLPQDWVTDESFSDSGVQDRAPYGLAVDELLKADDLRRRNADAFHRLVTAWAVDPATHAGQLQPTMSPSSFNPRRIDGEGNITQPGWVRKSPNVLLPFSVPKTQEKNEIEAVPVKVALLGYAPELDPDTGERFVDLDIQSPNADSPFVRLSLVRFQPNALQTEDEHGNVIDLRASSQVVIEPVQLPPMRTVETEWTEAGLRITITGPAYDRRSPIPPGFSLTTERKEEENVFLDEHHHETDVPWMRIRVMRRFATTLNSPESFVQAADADSSELIRVVPFIPNGDTGIWSVNLPIGNKKDHYRIFIEEYEYYFSRDDTGNVVLTETPRAFKIEIDP